MCVYMSGLHTVKRYFKKYNVLRKWVESHFQILVSVQTHLKQVLFLLEVIAWNSKILEFKRTGSQGW